jgi:hypothetical protein
MRKPIPATLTIDASAFAALGGSLSPETTAVLSDVRNLLIEVRDRLTSNAAIMVDGAGAEKLMGVSERTLRNHGVAAVKVGSRRMYRVETLRGWAIEREKGDEPKA